MICLKKRWSSCFLIVILLLSYTTVAFAGQIDDKKRELEGVNENIKNAQNEVEQVKGEQNNISNQLIKLEEDLKTKKAQLEEIERKLAETQDNIETTKEELREAIEKAELHKKLMDDRLCAMYMCSTTSYLEVLFEAKSFTDFLDRVVMVREIMSLDQQVLGEMQSLKEEIEGKKQLLEEQEQAEQKAKADIITQKAAIEENQREKEVLLTKLKEEQAKIEADLEELERNSKELEETIKKLVAEREAQERKKKEEERKRKEEERKKQERLKQEGQKNSSRGSKSDDSGQYTGGTMTWPAPGYYSITSPFGYRTHPVLGGRRFHSGIDISGSGIYGSSAVAASSGTVILAQYYGGYGNCVIIDHGDGITTLYAHGSSILVSPGQSVKQGQAVLKIGSTGVSTGSHLHFEVRKNGSPVNPMNYLK